MRYVSHVTFTDELVTLDGYHFSDCCFDHCTLSYEGGVVILERTQITGCDYSLGGSARRTADLLAAVGMLPAFARVESEALELVH